MKKNKYIAKLLIGSPPFSLSDMRVISIESRGINFKLEDMPIGMNLPEHHPYPAISMDEENLRKMRDVIDNILNNIKYCSECGKIKDCENTYEKI